MSKEKGLSRLESIVGFDDSAGRRYQERTELFWNEVRSAWADVERRHRTVTLRASRDKKQLFVPLFEYAGKLDDGATYVPPTGARSRRRRSRATFSRSSEAGGSSTHLPA